MPSRNEEKVQWKSGRKCITRYQENVELREERGGNGNWISGDK